MSYPGGVRGHLFSSFYDLSMSTGWLECEREAFNRICDQLKSFDILPVMHGMGFSMPFWPAKSDMFCRVAEIALHIIISEKERGKCS